ncbi:MAG: porin [Gammaproteobacteria bacterium]|nr:porin [Gammaproteobacteria bacterium]
MLRSTIGVSPRLLISCLCALASPAFATETVIYGKVHMSVEGIHTGLGNDAAVSSNASHIGFKGSDMLGDWAAATWRLESDIDVSGERGFLRARNRYVGIATKFGSVTVGVHDTPWKSVGLQFDVFDDTLFDARNLLGITPYASLDSDAKNSVYFKSPLWGGIQLNALQSAGEEKGLNGGDVTRLSSVSITFKSEAIKLAAAYERQDLFKTSALRLNGSMRIAMFRVNGIYERVESSAFPLASHEVLGGNATIAFGRGFSILAQGVGVLNSAASKFVALMGCGGLNYSPAKPVQLYLIGGQMINGSASSYPLGNGGHGEQYALSAAGEDPYGVTFGIIYKF